MRILYIDIDTLRADHLGCYGYVRNTSPNIDRVAADGVRFENCYVSDAPCLPSRASTFMGRFGIRTGVVGHGGTAADPRPIGPQRAFNTMNQRPGLVWLLRRQGIYPVSVSPFAERHSAWWFCEGWREFINPGKGGMEIADEVGAPAIDWIARNARLDHWLLHVHFWDPHTPYRAPESFGNPFADEPLEGWYTDHLRQAQWSSFGPGSPQEPAGAFGQPSRYPRQPSQVASMDDYKKWIDGYDCGIRYADSWCGRILNCLADAGVLDQTLVVITSDHGENLGELAVIGDHAVADHVTSRVPLIVRGPGVQGGGRVDAALHYLTDMAAALVEMAGGTVPPHWDGTSMAESLRRPEPCGRPYLVLSQMCWSAMRAVRWGDWLMIRTYHTGLKNYPARMLFNVARDPHELTDLASAEPAIVTHGQTLLDAWTAEMVARSDAGEDPMHGLLREGGPYHTRGQLAEYCARLRATGRARHAEFLERHPTGLADG